MKICINPRRNSFSLLPSSSAAHPLNSWSLKAVFPSCWPVWIEEMRKLNNSLFRTFFYNIKYWHRNQYDSSLSSIKLNFFPCIFSSSCLPRIQIINIYSTSLVLEWLLCLLNLLKLCKNSEIKMDREKLIRNINHKLNRKLSDFDTIFATLTNPEITRNKLQEPETSDVSKK